MPAYLNTVTISAPQNGTTSHTVDPSSGTVLSGASFTPTSGRRLVCLASGAVTMTTPSGWTLPTNGSAVGGHALYLWHKVAAGGDTITTTHNGSNYPLVVSFFEFAAGTSFVAAVNSVDITRTAANPNLTGLTGSNTVIGAAGYNDATVGGTVTGAWGSPNVEVVDSDIDRTGADGAWLGVAYQDSYVSPSYAPTLTITETGTQSSNVSERITFAVVTPVGGSSVSLDGTTAGASTTTGALTVAHPLAAASASTSTSTGDLTVSHPLASTTNGASSTTGALSLALPLAGTSAGTSTSTGTLALITPLAGTTAGTSTSTGALTVAHPLAGITAGTSTSTGNLAVAHPLAGTSAGTSTTTGDITLAGQQALAGASAGTSSSTGALTVAHPLAGTSASSSATTGDLAVARPLAGTSAGSSATTGTLTTVIPLSGTSAGSSTSTGDIRITLGLAGTSAGTATTTGALRLTVALTALSGSASTSTGSARVTYRFAGASTGTSTTTGDLTRQGLIEDVGLLEGVTSVSLREAGAAATQLEAASVLALIE